MDVLRRTLSTINAETALYKDYFVHYAIKANNNPLLLRQISKMGLGADCVSGGEIQVALNAGFPANKIVFAGVGKRDDEITLALKHGILCFNVESCQELEIINLIAGNMKKTAKICLRINPDVEAHTHTNITTGLVENKFGILHSELQQVIELAKKLPNIYLCGLHFHIGSQILDMTDFRHLCSRINELCAEAQKYYCKTFDIINVGGGLGIDYIHPEEHPIADFHNYFSTFNTYLRSVDKQQIHFELGRSVVGQCGWLVTDIVFIKQSGKRKFAIVDAGMNDLIRPALYDAYHKIKKLNDDTNNECIYDIVGPICESSDLFGHNIPLPTLSRGDRLIIMSAGAYGESMASCYNSRPLIQGYISDEITSLA